MKLRLVPAWAGLLLCAAVTPSVARANGVAKGPYPMKATQNSIVVCWVSDRNAPGTVEYAAAPDGRTDAYTGRVEDKTPVRYHRVKLTGLKPYTRYAYRVTCDARMAQGSFITAAPKDQPFKFVAYGDTRTQPKVHASVLKRIAAFHPDFIIASGDQVANGSNEELWDEFWQVASPTFRDTVYYPALGNHEGHGAPYFRYFDVPAHYSFDYGNAHFVCLDSTVPDSEWPAEVNWLKGDLAAHQDATWRVVFFHHTVHTCVDIPRRHEEAAQLAARLEPVFEAQHVQLVVNGHDHDYQHHFAHGIHYIVSGGGGAPLYTVTPNTPYVVKAKSAYNECEINVNGPEMSIRVVQPDGAVIEQFTVKANP